MKNRGKRDLTEAVALEVRGYVETSAFAGADDAMIARAIRVSKEALVKKFGAIMAEKRAQRQVAVLAAQQKFALKGNATLLIWIGKQPLSRGGLGQVDEMSLSRNINFNALTDEELEDIAQGKAKLQVVRGGKAANGSVA